MWLSHQRLAVIVVLFILRVVLNALPPPPRHVTKGVLQHFVNLVYTNIDVILHKVGRSLELYLSSHLEIELGVEAAKERALRWLLWLRQERIVSEQVDPVLIF